MTCRKPLYLVYNSVLPALIGYLQYLFQSAIFLFRLPLVPLQFLIRLFVACYNDLAPHYLVTPGIAFHFQWLPFLSRLMRPALRLLSLTLPNYLIIVLPNRLSRRHIG